MEQNNTDNSSCTKRKYTFDIDLKNSTEKKEEVTTNTKTKTKTKRRIKPQLISHEVLLSVRNVAEKENQSRQDDVIDRWEPTANVHYRGAMIEPKWRQAILNGLPTPEPSDSEAEFDNSGNEVVTDQPAFTSLRDMRPAQDKRQRLRMSKAAQQRNQQQPISKRISSLSSQVVQVKDAPSKEEEDKQLRG
jgi:hypothetical protein